MKYLNRNVFRLAVPFFILILFNANPLRAKNFEKDNGLAPTPPMGWNSWNWFGKHNINETVVYEVIDAIAESGLQDVGYEYVIIDGGWRDKKLAESGELLANPEKFPNGIKPLADYAHSKGLKFGLHTVPGTHDCGGDQVGGFGNEEVQLNQFIDWGIDFIKLDKCRFQDNWNEELLKKTYYKWARLIEQSGQDIILNVSAYKFRDWNPKVCQMSRTTLDIGANANKGAHFDYTEKERNFLSVMQVAEENSESASFAGNGYWNDPDMLVIGNDGLTIEEQKSHFALWCIMSSPLFLGNDPRNISQEEKSIITNELAIGVNQDPTEQGTRISQKGKTEIWVKHLENKSVAVLLLNRDKEKEEKIDLNFSEIDSGLKAKVTDIYSKRNLGVFEGGLTKTVNAGEGVFLLITPF